MKFRKSWDLLFLLVAVVLTVLIGCGAEDASETQLEEDGQEVFTIEELKQYNGEDGQPAYIAVEGVVYDVTNVSQWRNAFHHGFQAGIDATEALDDAPHGASMLESATVVGSIKDE